MTCGACGAENPQGFAFCGACGSALGGTPCPSCGRANPAGQRFCGWCGAATDAPAAVARPAPVGERKLATVLFADVVGFTSLAERTDHEVVARTVDAAFRRLGEVVAEHGGTVDKYMGDSVMAVFGVPVAHDDDAERAVAAGLAMRELGGDLAFSIGINSGEVMVGEVGRDGDVTVIGDTVNVAARLEKAAGPGEVLVGPLTRELARPRVVFRERAPVVLKGKREPVAVWEAVSVRGAGESSGERLPLVGRDDELAFLEAQWRRVRADGRASVVLLCGEAGSGTTSLLDALGDHVAADGGSVVRAAYPGYGGMGGPRVAAELVRQLGSSGDADIDARVRSIAGELHPSLHSLDPSGMRQEQLWAFRRLLEIRADEHPLLLALDEFHRAGPGTVDLVAEIAARLGAAPVLLVLVGRPDPSEWLTRFPGATTVRLGALGRGAMVELANALVGDRPLSDDAAAFLVERAGGNPLYLRELVRVVRDQGALVEGDASYDLVLRTAVPPTLQAVIAARLDALDPEQKLVVQHLAVLGGEGTEAQVHALGFERSGAVLRGLVDCGVVQVRADGRHAIADPLMREVAYETLPRNVRGERHLVAVDAATSKEEAARHWDRAASYLPERPDVVERARGALVVAGIELLDTLREADGCRLLRRAVELGHREPADLLRLANALNTTGHADIGNDVLALVPEATGDPVLDAERAHLSVATYMFSDPRRAVDGLEAVAARWHELGNRAKEGWAHANAGVAWFNLGRFEDSATLLERSVPCFQAAGDRAGELAALSFLALVRPEDPRVPGWLEEAKVHAATAGDRSRQLTALTTLSWNRYFATRLGSAEEAAGCEREAAALVEVATEMGFDDMATQGLCLQASLARLTGRFDEAEVHVRRAQAIRQAETDRERLLLAAVSLDVGDADGGSSLEPFDTDNPDPVISVARVVAAESLLLAGRSDEVIDRMDWLRFHIGQTGTALRSGEGLALLLADRPAEALPLLEAARRASQALGATPSAAAAVALLAEARARTGDVAGARAELGPEPPGPSVAQALHWRARAVLGDEGAADRVQVLAALLRAPGLAVGMPAADAELSQ